MLHQSSPGEGPKQRRTHFGYVSTHAGKQWHGYIAGPCHWFECHPLGKTKPCLHAVTKGALACPWCDTTRPAELTGYQPLYRELDSKPCMVIVHADVRDAVDQLRFHQRVLVGRGEDATDGVYIMPALRSDPRFHSTLPDRNRPADLTATLLAVWKVPELVAWHTAQAGAQPAARTVAVNDQGKPVSPMMQAAARKLGAQTTDDPKKVAEYDELLNRLKGRVKDKPSTNGKH